MGSVILVRSDGSTVATPSGAYQAVTAIAGDGSTNWAAGVTWARIQQGSLGTEAFESSSISGPTYFGASSYSGNLFLYCGEAGSCGSLDPQAGTTTSLGRAYALDWLDAKPIAADTVFTCGVSQLGIHKYGASPSVWFVQGKTFTTALVYQDTVYLGTTSGDIYSVAASTLTSGTFVPSDLAPIAQNLGSTIVSINPSGPWLQLTLQNGTVYSLPQGGSPTVDFALPKQTLTHPTTTVEPTGSLYLCGNDNFLCKATPPDLSIYTLPGSIYQLTMHGSIGLGDYWVGGYSGTLYLISEDNWYTVNTGIGNQLYSIGANSDYLIVGATFGGLRYDNSQFIKTAIDPSASTQIPSNTASCDVARTGGLT